MKNNFKIGSTLICKSNYEYNGCFKKGDIFTIIGFNEFNIRLKTPINTFHNISYVNKKTRYLWDHFYTNGEIINMKINKIKRCITM